MNPLTHVFITKRLIDEHNLRVDEDQCILGSVISDLACLNAINYKKAHEDPLGFIHYLMEKDPEMVSVGYGMLLHSEKPGGVDKYTHGPNGFIEEHEMAMFEIVSKYKHKMHAGQLKGFIHALIEWSCDSLLTKREANLLNRSFRNVDTKRLSFHLANYFDGDGKKLKRIFRFLRRFNFNQLTHVKGVAKCWDRFEFYQRMADKKGLRMMTHITSAWSLIKHNNTVEMIERARDHLRNIYPAYLDFLHGQLSENLVPHFPQPIKVSKIQSGFSEQ
ncbi:MAG: hypothetical protein ACE5FT_02625 [Candidatus Nanoarchaeia archaeon]